MTPDMKRLCQAAWKAETEGLYCDHLGEASVDDACDLDQERYQAIVHAVLMAPREPDPAMLEAVSEKWRPYLSGEGIGIRFASVIDHILADPVKA